MPKKKTSSKARELHAQAFAAQLSVDLMLGQESSSRLAKVAELAASYNQPTLWGTCILILQSRSYLNRDPKAAAELRRMRLPEVLPYEVTR